MNATASAALLAQQTALQAAGIAEKARIDGADGRAPRGRFTEVLRQQSGPEDAADRPAPQAARADAGADGGAVRLKPVAAGQAPTGGAPRGSFIDIRI